MVKRLLLGLLASLVLALCGAAPSMAQQVTARAPGGFYDPPRGRSLEHGALLRSEPLRNVMLPPGVRGWRILYSTSINDRTPATAVATIFAPEHAPPGPRPVILWTHGATGLVQRCMPSLVSAPSEGIPARPEVAAAGWVIIATDYSFAEKHGPHPFLIGEGEARATLDSLRAARQVRGLNLDSRAVVWGHSQGGHAALWTGMIAPAYAPDLRILGIAAIAPAADLPLILQMNPEVDRWFGPSLATAYSRFYPDVRLSDALRPGARRVAHEMASLCGFLPPEDPARLGELVASFEGPALNAAPNTPLARRIAENIPNRPIAAPLLIVQGGTDTIIPPLSASLYAQERCAAGQRMDFWVFPHDDHGTLVQPNAALTAPLMDWTRARFAGAPQAPGCASRTF